MIVVYFSSTKKILYPDNIDHKKLKNLKSTIFVTWHNELSSALFCGKIIFRRIVPKMNLLISPHTDGKILSILAQKFGYEIISGSTNKSSYTALKTIIYNLKSGKNIGLTPDGPRGPIYEINSNITEICNKFNCKIIILSSIYKSKITLNSWDRFKIPLPFGKIIIKFTIFDNFSNDIIIDKTNLKNEMMKNLKLLENDN